MEPHYMSCRHIVISPCPSPCHMVWLAAVETRATRGFLVPPLHSSSRSTRSSFSARLGGPDRRLLLAADLVSLIRDRPSLINYIVKSIDYCWWLASCVVVPPRRCVERLADSAARCAAHSLNGRVSAAVFFIERARGSSQQRLNF